MMVSEVFNDFFTLLAGKKPVGLAGLMDKYREEPLFFILLSNLLEVSGISPVAAMKDAYRIYKEFSAEPLDGPGLENLYSRAAEYVKKWDNLWCSQLIVALAALLDPDREEAAGIRDAEEKKQGEAVRDADKKEEEPEEERDGTGIQGRAA